MGASKKKQMRYFDKDWADQIFASVQGMNAGNGAAWLLPLSALAITGARPAALERGIEFSVVEEGREFFIQAAIPGVKLRSDRGQPSHIVRWDIKKIETHRRMELKVIVQALQKSESKKIVVRYDAEAISTRLRELSVRIWPRKKFHITAYCYRQLFCSAAKSAGAAREEIAMAMGHLSSASQGKYLRKMATRGSFRPIVKPWSAVSAALPVKPPRDSLARFKAASAKKSARKKISS